MGFQCRVEKWFGSDCYLKNYITFDFTLDEFHYMKESRLGRIFLTCKANMCYSRVPISNLSRKCTGYSGTRVSNETLARHL